MGRIEVLLPQVLLEEGINNVDAETKDVVGKTIWVDFKDENSKI